MRSVLKPAVIGMVVTLVLIVAVQSMRGGFSMLRGIVTTAEPCTDGRDSIGLYYPSANRFDISNTVGQGFADFSFEFKPGADQGLSFRPIAGKWEGTRVPGATVGLVGVIIIAPRSTVNYVLRSSNAPPAPGYTGDLSAGHISDLPIARTQAWLPIAGDWFGEGKDRLGAYDPAESRFYLAKTASFTPSYSISFVLGTPNAGLLPVAGDWDGDGKDSVGLYNPVTSTFTLWNENSAAATVAFTTPYGLAGGGWLPLAGDWDGDGVDTISLYDPVASYFYIVNSNTPDPSYSDVGFGFGGAGAGGMPIAGDFCIYACSDGRDNDGDGQADLQDSGCYSALDNNEGDSGASSSSSSFLSLTAMGLTLEASAPATVARGTKAVFRARVRNTTTSTIQGVALHQLISEWGTTKKWDYPSIHFDSASLPACNDPGFGEIAFCSLSSLAPGAVSPEVTVTVSFENQDLPCPITLVNTFSTTPLAGLDVPFTFVCTGASSSSSVPESSASSLSSCVSVSCTPPAEGCTYVNPVVQDGCVLDCGTLTCSSSSEISSFDSSSVSETSSLSAASSLALTSSVSSEIAASSVSSASSVYSVAILSSSSQASQAVSYCGDGVVDPSRGEGCEANSDCGAGMVCSVNCLCEPGTGGVCGNGIRESKEECERDSPCVDAGKTCSNCRCVQGAVCNNGIMERGEMCENNQACPGGAVCSNCLCIAVQRCGNGVLDSGEQCENDAQCVGSQVCSTTTCRCMGDIVGTCGDSVLDAGEECELGNPCSDPAKYCAVSNCVCTDRPVGAACGNGIIDSGEDCEVAHPCEAGQACNFASCHCAVVTPRCGDGALNPGEECELDHACSAPESSCDLRSCACVQAPASGNICGNGTLDPGEGCEVGAPCPLGWKCDFPNCRCDEQAFCGDGVLDANEQCETNQPCLGGNQTCDFSRCRCSGRVVLCGNGVQDPDEQCDDGNTTSGDGCSGICVREQRTVVAGVVGSCGNGFIEGTEECDDGNGFNGDGCSAACTQEFFGAPSGEVVSSVPTVEGTEIAAASASESSLVSGAPGGRLIGSLVPLGSFSTVPGNTGPATLAVIAVGAAAGGAWIRRKKRSGK